MEGLLWGKEEEKIKGILLADEDSGCMEYQYNTQFIKKKIEGFRPEAPTVAKYQVCGERNRSSWSCRPSCLNQAEMGNAEALQTVTL
ncbi:unnamed protein product [Caretta caretta]